MRHAARERADALEPLRSQELLLEVLLLGDIGVDGQDGLRLAGFIYQQRPMRANNHARAVVAQVL